MIKKSLTSLAITSLLLMASAAPAYDMELANSYQNLFANVAGAKLGKHIHLIKPDVFVEDIKKGKAQVTLDVRTEKELGIFAMTLPGSMRIPVNVLFKRENLDRLPTDVPIVVICKSGVRATAAATALRHTGFNNAYILKGGIKGLSAYLGPKEANMPPKPAKLTMK